MLRLASMMATATILLSVDAFGAAYLSAPIQHVDLPADKNLSVLLEMAQGNSQDQTASTDVLAGKALSNKGKGKVLQPASRLALVRSVDGEFVRVVAPLPGGKKGFHFKAGVPLNQQQLRMALGSSGAAINPGDNAQITALEFKDREIVVDVNGGGRGKTKLRDRIHMEVGMPVMIAPDPGTTVQTKSGATLYLDFDMPLPDMTPDDLKRNLSGLLDFSKRRSAAVQWIDALPPDIQQAITDKRPVVGMDRETVLAAIGRPDRKVREKTTDGTETEDWIYGKPPAKTIFVTFEGDKVTQVEQFP